VDYGLSNEGMASLLDLYSSPPLPAADSSSFRRVELPPPSALAVEKSSFFGEDVDGIQDWDSQFVEGSSLLPPSFSLASSCVLTSASLHLFLAPLLSLDFDDCVPAVSLKRTKLSAPRITSEALAHQQSCPLSPVSSACEEEMFCVSIV
jgi:hypothetical protein